MIQLRSIDGDLNDNTPGAADFGNGSAQSWIMAVAASGVTNFARDKFTRGRLGVPKRSGRRLFRRADESRTLGLLLSFVPNSPPSADDVTCILPRRRSPADSDLDAGGRTGAIRTAIRCNCSSVNGSSSERSRTTFPATAVTFITPIRNAPPTRITYTVADVRTNPPAVYRPGDTVQTAVGFVNFRPTGPSASIALLGSNVVISGANWPTGAMYYVLTSTNVSLPLTNWSQVGTGFVDGAGNLGFTNRIELVDRYRFFVIQVP